MAAKKRERLAWIGRDHSGGYLLSRTRLSKCEEPNCCDGDVVTTRDYVTMCSGEFHACTSFRLKPGQVRRVRITIEEVAE